MQILILTSLGVFFLVSILFLALYLKMKNKWFETDKELQKSTKEQKNLNQMIEQIKDDLSTKRIGYYYDTVNLENIRILSCTALDHQDKKAGKTGEPYNLIVHVKELDRYTNGMSKIQLTSLELISGFDHNQYDWVKQCTREEFSSLKKTSEIEWLESEEHIKEQRKQKLEKILNTNK